MSPDIRSRPYKLTFLSLNHPCTSELNCQHPCVVGVRLGVRVATENGVTPNATE